MLANPESAGRAGLGRQVSYILGSFVGGTALLCGAAAAGWYYTKYSLGVKDVRAQSRTRAARTAVYITRCRAVDVL